MTHLRKESARRRADVRERGLNVVIADTLMRSHLMPFELREKFSVSRPQAQELIDAATQAFGPGGKGIEWMEKQAAKILAVPRPSRLRVPSRQAGTHSQVEAIRRQGGSVSFAQGHLANEPRWTAYLRLANSELFTGQGDTQSQALAEAQASSSSEEPQFVDKRPPALFDRRAHSLPREVGRRFQLDEGPRSSSAGQSHYPVSDRMRTGVATGNEGTESVFSYSRGEEEEGLAIRGLLIRQDFRPFIRRKGSITEVHVAARDASAARRAIIKFQSE